jgi:pilus assembly protein Flp/PilA
MFLDYLSLAIRRFVKDEEAASAIEYAIIASLIAVAIAATLTNVGTQIKTTLTSVVTALGGS